MIFENQSSSMMDVYAVVIEIEYGGKTQRKSMQAPRIFIEQEFISLVQDISSHNVPMKIRMYRIENVWDQFYQRTRDNLYEIIVKNQAYLNMEK